MQTTAEQGAELNAVMAAWIAGDRAPKTFKRGQTVLVGVGGADLQYQAKIVRPTECFGEKTGWWLVKPVTGGRHLYAAHDAHIAAV